MQTVQDILFITMGFALMCVHHQPILTDIPVFSAMFRKFGMELTVLVDVLEDKFIIRLQRNVNVLSILSGTGITV